MKSLTSMLLIFLSLAGIIDASYISYQRFQGIVPPCIPGFQCEKVLNSPWAKIGPVPLSVLGVIYYTVVFILAIYIFLEKPIPGWLQLRRYGARMVDLLRLVTTFGLFFSIYLVSIMAWVIEGWCTYCLVSALICLLLFITAWWHARITRTNDSYFLRGVWFAIFAVLYKIFGKPLFFLFDPEKVHESMVKLGSVLGNMAIGRWLLRTMVGFHSPLNQTRLAGITFPNRVGLSAGYDYNGDLTQTLASVGFGWQTVGTVTLRSYQGNTPPRLTRLPRSKSILVNKGLKNIGASAVINKLAGLQFPIPVGISIASTNQGYANDREQLLDIAGCFRLFEKSAVQFAFYEMNISCPNTFGGEPFTTPRRLETLLKILDQIATKPIFVKLPIDLPEQDFLNLLAVCDRHIIAGLIIGNLTKDKQNPDVDPEDVALWKTRSGNLSGKPTFARSNKLIALAAKKYGNRFVIVGTGGIFSAADAQTKLAAGADLVQLITGMIYQGPQLIGQINRELAGALDEP